MSTEFDYGTHYAKVMAENQAVKGAANTVAMKPIGGKRKLVCKVRAIPDTSRQSVVLPESNTPVQSKRINIGDNAADKIRIDRDRREREAWKLARFGSADISATDLAL